MRCARSATWFPIVPESTSRASSFPVRSAMKRSRDWVVGSSMKTSSSSVHFCIAASMDAVGVVVTSERKSNAAGFVSEPHALPLMAIGALGFVPLAVYAANSDMLRRAEVCICVNGTMNGIGRGFAGRHDDGETRCW